MGPSGKGLGRDMKWEERDEKEGEEASMCMGGRCVLQGGSSCHRDDNGCHLTDQKGGKRCVKDEFPQL